LRRITYGNGLEQGRPGDPADDVVNANFSVNIEDLGIDTKFMVINGVDRYL
jgi:hypothetical protein